MKNPLQQFFAGLLALATAVINASALAAPVVYSVAIVPQYKPQQLQQEWQPILDRIGTETGARFELRHYPSIPEFEKSFLSGEVDFVYMNPYHVVMAHRAQGYIPLVADEKPLNGILVVAARGPITQLKDLDGKKIAFPAPNAFGASLLMRALLTENAKVDFTPSYVKTHANVYRQVIAGDAAAGGGVNATYADLPAEARANLRILFETPGAAAHPMMAHPRVPKEMRAAFAKAFLGLTQESAGQALLREARVPRPVTVDYARDYRPLEKLRLEKYVVLE
jgi:phosphonate transport system substrate-binding protein